MKSYKELLNEVKTEDETDNQYAAVLKGGSIGGKPIRSVKDLKGKKVSETEKLFDNIDDAKETVKRRNKILSPGEKKYYNLRYIVARVKDGVFTGK